MTKPIRSFFGPILCAGLAWLGAAATAQVPDARASHPFAQSRPIAGRYIVVLKQSVANPAAEAANAMSGGGGQLHYIYSAALKGFAATLPDAAVQSIRNNPAVDYVEQDQTVSLNQVSPESNATWGLDRIDQADRPVDGLYHFNYTGAGVTAFIIDTGIRADHVDFGGRVLAGYNTVSSDTSDTNDCNGHGTHVSGTVGGTTWGVAKQVSLRPVRVLDCRGSGTYSGVIAGIDWVASSALRPAVANMSLGGGKSAAMNAAVAGAVAKGVTMVVAAGNSSADACNYSPASEPSALTVGATTSSDTRASYSNYGSCVDVFAPGSSITSDWNTSSSATNTISGTSMASPHVTGVAALATEANPGASPAAIASFITSKASINKVISAGTGSPNLLLYSLGAGTATEPAQPVIAIQSLSGAGARNGRNWRAQVTAAVRDVNSSAAMANVTVSGSFSTGGTASCVTSGSGSCTLTSAALSPTTPSTVFTLTNLSGTSMIYDASQNLAVQITINKP
jgi:subtilisin family serine protease